MNIFMVGPDSASKGGISTVISNFKKHFRVEGKEISYFDSWSESHPIRSSISAIFSVRKKVKESKADVIHMHVAQKGSFLRKSILALTLSKKYPIIFHMHASQFDTFYEQANPILKKYIRWVLCRVEQLVVLSTQWRDFYESVTGRTDIQVVENAVQLPENYHYNPDAVNIVTFGRIGKRKGSYDILKLAKAIGKIHPKIQFVLYGDGELDTVQQKIEKLELKNVQLGGWLTKEEQSSIFKSTLLHLLPSYQEGLPMAILESMSFGIPNMASTVGGIPEVVIDQENGMLIEAGRVNEMEEKLLEFLNDKGVRNTYSQAARNKIEQEFAIDPYFYKWVLLYDNLEK
ncbi:glycosyltransferase family 4 protein [Listeria booriae]|uniref:glycosyltransferase family 4 protein n=1 Tax=Listeria booriae TaxID=1552123 RepID=UPI001629AAB8|nr:glycosyltransferase family 4 protein [Listeria booriae]MBC2370367.1 glycosyltransferase family 4 protein [Listeria booriae]